MNATYLFPTALIALDVLSAIGYAIAREWRMVLYWLAAATLTASVTYK